NPLSKPLGKASMSTSIYSRQTVPKFPLPATTIQSWKPLSNSVAVSSNRSATTFTRSRSSTLSSLRAHDRSEELARQLPDSSPTHQEPSENFKLSSRTVVLKLCFECRLKPT